eukprot:scaffold582_cov385-Prasinococcus_capsulatus_cf.AAC.45
MGLGDSCDSGTVGVMTLSGITDITVTIGDNNNYPNPPAWGISFHLNGQESPVLEVVRGTTYTFTITAGATHPVYITDDIIGGNSNPNEVIYAGGQDSFGTTENPYILTWTPDDNTPDLVYYQCYTHLKLGWEISVSGGAAVDSDDETGCSKNHPYVGFTGALSELQHMVRGEIEVLDDCSFKVTDFRYDGRAPAAYWLGAASESRNDLRRGFRLRDGQVAGADGMTTRIIDLKPGITWDSIKVISVWCELAAANFGSVTLEAVQERMGPVGNRPQCDEIDVFGELRSFEACQDLTLQDGTFKISWNVSEVAPESRRLLSGGVHSRYEVDIVIVTDIDDWAGFGISETPGRMVGAQAVIGYVDDMGIGNVTQYELQGQAESQVVPGGDLLLSNVAIGAMPQGGVTMAFTLELASIEEDFDVIWATGRVNPARTGLGPLTPGLIGHSFTRRNGGTLNFQTGLGSAETQSTLYRAHGILMAISWGFIIPTGVAVARVCKNLGVWWFKVHICLQGAGYLLALVGFGIGIHVTKDRQGHNIRHRTVGIAVTTMGALQVLTAALRPHNKSQQRRLWNLWHWTMGRAAVICAVFNVYEGFNLLQVSFWKQWPRCLQLASHVQVHLNVARCPLQNLYGDDKATVYRDAYTGVLFTMVGLALSKEYYDYYQLPPPGAKREPPGTIGDK